MHCTLKTAIFFIEKFFLNSPKNITLAPKGFYLFSSLFQSSSFYVSQLFLKKCRFLLVKKEPHKFCSVQETFEYPTYKFPINGGFVN